MKILAYLVFGIDNIIYKTIGWATPIRRAVWARRSKELQRALNYQHNYVAKHNAYAANPISGYWYVQHGMIDSVKEINHLGEI